MYIYMIETQKQKELRFEIPKDIDILEHSTKSYGETRWHYAQTWITAVSIRFRNVPIAP